MGDYIARLAVFTFITQWPWEMIQMSAYAGMENEPWSKAVSTCTLATLGDLGIVTLVYSLLALKNRNCFHSCSFPCLCL